MPQYYLTNTAVGDLREIVEYTLAEWGQEQVLKYRGQLESRLHLLAEMPGMGRANPNLPDGILYVVEGKHYVFYRAVEDGIEVLRFLHARVDVLRHLSDHL